MFNDHFVKIFIKDAVALFCAINISLSTPAYSDIRHCEGFSPKQSMKEIASLPSVARNDSLELWMYLRKGINYLEASGRDVPLALKHPGGKAYGPLALTPIAVKDVKAHYPCLARYSFEDIISKRSLYEQFAYLYADLLLTHYIKVDYLNMPREEVFVILQKAWFLGPTLYKKGRSVITSRETKTRKYTAIKS